MFVMQTSAMKAAFKLPSAAFLLQIYEIFLFSASFWLFLLCFQRKNVNLQKKIRLRMGKFINPFSDWGFKLIFGQEITKDLLISFLNDLLKGEHKSQNDISYASPLY